MSNSIFHTDRKWVAGLCYVGFLVFGRSLLRRFSCVDVDGGGVRVFSGDEFVGR